MPMRANGAPLAASVAQVGVTAQQTCDREHRERRPAKIAAPLHQFLDGIDAHVRLDLGQRQLTDGRHLPKDRPPAGRQFRRESHRYRHRLACGAVTVHVGEGDAPARPGSAHVAEPDVPLPREPAGSRRRDDTGSAPRFRQRPTDPVRRRRPARRLDETRGSSEIGRAVGVDGRRFVAGERDRRDRGAADELVAVAAERAREQAARGCFHLVGDLIG